MLVPDPPLRLVAGTAVRFCRAPSCTFPPRPPLGFCELHIRVYEAVLELKDARIKVIRARIDDDFDGCLRELSPRQRRIVVSRVAERALHGIPGGWNAAIAEILTGEPQ